MVNEERTACQSTGTFRIASALSRVIEPGGKRFGSSNTVEVTRRSWSGSTFQQSVRNSIPARVPWSRVGE